MINYKDYIISDYKIMLGKPIIKGTRITVELILKKLSEGVSIPLLIEMYPQLNTEQVHAALEYASNVVGNEEVLELA
ncbi:MAG: antitoxin [Ignavibacteria bacterium GWB2_35_12]|nr:MAG: antitoxin [Ignavibacteria bacterium GWA2_35_8]OGU42603.1 MAG: antitoxin [Ignavibacteria bacterium GWB2_35_12]OGU96432.1 MAG: antitoxin [Ignavibacteria bacterium RIFOXYA2_FULL_35_10]OGV18595.1 MAG: antitoxin [Ignavibacteria bacterium RIFOXYC2_FULL_35_21]